MKIPAKLITIAKKLATVASARGFSVRTRKAEKEIDALLSPLGVKKRSHGAFRTTFIFPGEWVLKISSNIGVEPVEFDFKYLSKLGQSNLIRRHFPETKLINDCVLIQEKIKGIASRGELKEQLAGCVSDFATDEFGIEDMHIDNYGWKKDEETKIWYPVFVDFQGGFGEPPRPIKKLQKPWEAHCASAIEIVAADRRQRAAERRRKEKRNRYAKIREQIRAGLPTKPW